MHFSRIVSRVQPVEVEEFACDVRIVLIGDRGSLHINFHLISSPFWPSPLDKKLPRMNVFQKS